MHRLVAATLAFVCLSTFNPAFACSAQDQAPTERVASFKQRVVGIPAGTVIEVRLQQQGSKTITGRLGSITDEGFEVQTVKSGKISSEKVAFTDVKSVKEKHGMSRVTKTLIVTGVVVGVLCLIVAIGRTPD